MAADDAKPTAVDQVNTIPMTTINVIDAAEAKSVIADAKVNFGAHGDSKAVSKATNFSIPSKPTSSIMGMNEKHLMDDKYVYNTYDVASTGDSMSSVSSQHSSQSKHDAEDAERATIESKMKEMQEKAKEMQQQQQMQFEKQHQRKKQLDEKQRQFEKEQRQFEKVDP